MFTSRQDRHLQVPVSAAAPQHDSFSCEVQQPRCTSVVQQLVEEAGRADWARVDGSPASWRAEMGLPVRLVVSVLMKVDSSLGRVLGRRCRVAMDAATFPAAICVLAALVSSASSVEERSLAGWIAATRQRCGVAMLKAVRR